MTLARLVFVGMASTQGTRLAARARSVAVGTIMVLLVGAVGWCWM